MSVNAPNAILIGGPGTYVPATGQVCYVENTATTTVKVRAGNCHEHFAPTAEHRLHDGNPLRVYNWSYRTYLAE